MKSAIQTVVANLCICCAAVVGCASSQGEPQQVDEPQLPKPQADQTYAPTATWPKGDKGGVVRYIRLHLGADVAKTCGLARSHFDFDASEPLPQDHGALKAIAECLNGPGLNTLPIEVVGRADTTGTSAYNLELGLKRAERVKSILVSEGVAASRISTASSGETGAVGDEKAVSGYSQGYDRRVDIVLKGVVHAPE